MIVINCHSKSNLWKCLDTYNCLTTITRVTCWEYTVSSLVRSKDSFIYLIIKGVPYTQNITFNLLEYQSTGYSPVVPAPSDACTQTISAVSATVTPRAPITPFWFLTFSLFLYHLTLSFYHLSLLVSLSLDSVARHRFTYAIHTPLKKFIKIHNHFIFFMSHKASSFWTFKSPTWRSLSVNLTDYLICIKLPTKMIWSKGT